LESANFEPVNTRLTSKKLGLRTDASSIFEKGIDPNLAETAVNRAAQLIEILGAGEVVSGVADCYPVKRAPWEVQYDPDNINKLLGTQIAGAQMEKYLERLDIEAKNGVAQIKTFRPDLKIEADIAEEVARLYGYDNIPVTLAAGGGAIGKKSRAQIAEDAIKESMAAQGLCEAMSYSFESPKVFDKLFLQNRAAVRIANPLGEDFSVMRTQALNAALNSLAVNYNRRNASARLFELAKIYIPKTGGGPPEKNLPEEILTLAIGEYPSDFYTVKGYIENLFERLGIHYSFKAVCDYPFLHPGRSAKVFAGELPVGFIGEIHPRVSQNYEIGARVCVASLNAEIIKDAAVFEKTYKQLPKFPGISRDVAFIVRDEITVGEIAESVKKSAGKYLESVSLFDVYHGEKIGDGFKSVAFNIFFRSAETTLKDSDIEENFAKIIKNAEEKFNAKIRG
jgi:phenylalanyl-tRNA synthetase beta chain